MTGRRDGHLLFPVLSSRMTHIEIRSINALAELDRVGWAYEPISNDEIRTRCPVHDDQRPSLALNTSKNLWKCYACNAKGDIITLLAHIGKQKRDAVVVDLSSRYEVESAKTIRPDVVERYHSKIWEAGPLLQALRDRGISDETIREARLGFHEGRITIPVYDLNGHVVNVRKYLPGAPTEKKMRNTPGYGKVRLYQLADVVKYDIVWICGGEMKAAVVKQLLNDKGIGACSSTSGEGSWDDEFNRYFVGKKVWVCMDVDKAGKAAARKIATAVSSVAESVRIINLPLDTTRFPKGDVNDLVGALHATGDDLLRLMEAAEEFAVEKVSAHVERGTKETKLSKVADPENMGWRLKFSAVAMAIDTTPYLVPKEINVSCSRDQPHCGICPVKREDPDEHGFVKCQIPATNNSILDMVNAAKNVQTVAIREGLGIPNCAAVEFDVRSHHRVIDARLSPKLEIMGENEGGRVQPGLLVNMDPELNAPYVMNGRVYPHPKTQQATLVIDEMSETEDSLSTFNPSREELDELKVFAPKDWTTFAIEEKLRDVYADLEANVTRIFGRRDLHLAIDLSYHSPLFFNLDNKRINGWMSTLIIGDSSQGKSETTVRLQQHYGLGERVECKNATVAGLLGGLQQMGTRWFVSWGVIPMHDRRLVMLEEVKGASIEVLSKLTDMRSSGIAEIPKIERRRTHARTRLIFISNPRSPRPMCSFTFGVEAVQELIGSLEDVRRFDLAVIVTRDDVSLDVINSNPVVDHVYTSDLCRRLVLWAWTLSSDKISFEPEALDALGSWTAKLGNRFSEALPLVDRGTIRYKLARMSAALAARTFSEDDGRLVVRKCHVDYACEFVERMYSEPKFGYGEFSYARETLERLTDREQLRKYMLEECARNADSLILGLLHKDDIDASDIMNFADADRDTADHIMSVLVRMHGLRRNGRSYSKTPEFIDLLKTLRGSASNKPRHQDLHDTEEM